MKRIINGVRYDTEKAEEIANWDNGFYQSDFNFVVETLYRTDLGNWFLVGEGGALSVYATPQRSAGVEFQVFCADEAKDWLENNNKIDALEKWFGSEIVDA